MVGRVAQHELIRFCRHGRARSLFFVVVVLLVAALVLSLRDYQLAYEHYEDNVRQARANWEAQTAKDPHDAAHDGTYIIKPIHPLALLDAGLRPFSGQVVHLSAHQRKQGSLHESKDHSGMFRFGTMTPTFVLIYVLPLLLIFVGYQTVTEERERQTIRLLLVQGISSRQLLLGKWMALAIIMLPLWLLFFASAGIAYEAAAKMVSVSPIEWAAMAVIYLAYFLIFINFIVWISATAKSSGIALTFLLTIWIVVTLIVPKVSTSLAGTFYPFPTLQTFRDAINKDQVNGLNGHNFWNEAAQDFQQQVLEEYGVERIEDLPVAYSGLLLAEGEKYESEIYTKHFDLLQDQYEKQREVYRWCSILSPLLPVRFVSMALARTDYGFLWHFEDEVEAYRVVLNTALNMNIAENAKGVEKYQAGTDLWETMPVFDYTWQAPGHITRAHAIELLLIALWAFLSFVGFLLFTRDIKAL